MIGTLADSLKKALKEDNKLSVQVDAIKEFCNFEDIKLPFKYLKLHYAEEVKYKLFQDCNYILGHLQPLDVSSVKEAGKPFRYDPLYKWILGHSEVVRALPKLYDCVVTSKHIVKNRRGLNRELKEFESSLHFGDSCLSYYIRWNPAELQWCAELVDKVIDKHKTLLGEAAVAFVEDMVSKSLFVPISMQEVGVSARFFVDSSILGECIIRDSRYKEMTSEESDSYGLNPRVYYIPKRLHGGGFRFVRDLNRSPRKVNKDK